MATTISSTGSNTSGAITTQGVGSGLDIASIVDKLVAVESVPLTNLKAKETAYQTKVSALASVSSALGQFQTTVGTLTKATAFSSLAASIDDASIATVTVDSTKPNALPVGNHTLQVTNLATSQRTASSSFADTTTAVGTGSISIDIGSWAITPPVPPSSDSTYGAFTPNATAGSKTITIDSTNDSLAGIRDAINAAGAGVTASIINDGTGNRLVIASSTTGSVNGFRISTTDASGNVNASGLSQIAFDPAASGGTPQTRHLSDGSDAHFLLDGLAISKATNHVTDVVDGLTLDLKAASAGVPTTIGVSRDTTNAKAAVNAFVSAYNTIVKGLKSLTSYDATSKTAGALNGDSSVRLIATRLQSLVATVLSGGGNVSSLSDIGVKFGDGGTLVVDDTRLTAALTGSPDAVSRLFAKTGASTDALVSYADSTDKTQVGSHAVHVDQLAKQGSLTGSSAAVLTTITAGSNDVVGLIVDNVAITITLQPGPYPDAAALATQLQSQINGSAALVAAGSTVKVSASGGVLTIGSQRYGSASNVAVTSGNGAVNLFGPAPTSAPGNDVAGTIDGVPFVGQGQTATGASSTSADGLALSITGGPIGDRGSVTLTRGIAALVNDTLTQFLDPTNGLLSIETAGLNSSITDVQKQEDRFNVRLVAIRAQLTAQYNAMDSLVASLNSTSSYLTQQLDALKKSTSNS